MYHYVSLSVCLSCVNCRLEILYTCSIGANEELILKTSKIGQVGGSRRSGGVVCTEYSEWS